MSKQNFIKKPNLGQQAASIRRLYPDFEVQLEKYNQLIVYGYAKPTARSCLYNFKLVYRHNKRPVIHILDPVLERGLKGEKPPHLYGDWSLCLYLPGIKEFTDYDRLSDTIIPWISLWLYYYEDWLTNGNVWNGGGIHPNVMRKTEKKPYIRSSISKSISFVKK
ncbi:hypothetical protein [Arsenicibacter rosenii]|uniref:hypothetical protein n=1 Tax=Arsenicibacter rosenii TaxID=1750698 RepID=UPI0011609B75|nr:hypothetical protein [Arsenicibacter rosenii]